MSAFVPVPCCFNYHSFVVLTEVWERYASRFVLFPQDYFGNSGSKDPCINFKIIYSRSVKNVMGNLIGTMDWKKQKRIKIAERNISNLRYADDTTLMAESEEELKSFFDKSERE